MDLFLLLKTVHVLSTVIWIGGMFFAYVVLRPSLTALEPPQRVALHRQVFRRFFLVVWHAMPLQVITGLWMLFGYYGGFGEVAWPIHAMFTLGVVMAAVFVMIVFGPYRRFRAASDPTMIVPALDSIRRMIGLNLVLGLVTIVIAILG
jgi:uncharacterized membrane protein